MFRARNRLDAAAALVRGALVPSLLFLLFACDPDGPTAPAPEPGTPDPAQSVALRTRTYFIAADPVEWNYAPSGINEITGEPFGEAEQIFVNTGPGIGLRYEKARYREYTDATFSELEPIPPEWQHLGILGPVVRAQVGDTIQVVFKNNADRPYSFHAHGVFYDKDSEGAPYDDGTSGTDKADDAVPPGATHTYTYPVPERAGPGPDDPSSVLWMYHSHTDEPRDANTGLVGPIIITARGRARADGRPNDVDREFVTLFDIFDEKQSALAGKNTEVLVRPGTPDGEGETDDADEQQDANRFHSINGYIFGNLPMPRMKQGEHVRWYLVALGGEADLHTPHWHGNTVLSHGTRRDTIGLLPMGTETVDMVPDAPGLWLFHCHIDDHMEAGMMARYEVLPAPAATAHTKQPAR